VPSRVSRVEQTFDFTFSSVLILKVLQLDQEKNSITMKLVAIFLLLTCSSQIQIQAQRSDFVDYLLQLQYATDPLYYYMLDYFNDARRELSSLLTELNDASVMEIIDGLRAVISIRDRVEEAAAGSGSTACVNETLSNWNTELETVGNEISHCVDSDLDQLNADVIRIHNFLLENNNLKFETQNMVLSVFTEVKY
jgi:recombinational DNA repair ATPase RecF